MTCTSCGLDNGDARQCACQNCDAEFFARRHPLRIGAPNSIARYASNTHWGANEWATFEYVGGMPVVRAAGSKAHCEHYMQPGRILTDIRPYKRAS